MSQTRPSAGPSTPDAHGPAAPAASPARAALPRETQLREAQASTLLALPTPRHLHAFLTRTQHLHFGYFEGHADTLAQAQDRLVLRSARLLPRNALVADVGCGLGG